MINDKDRVPADHSYGSGTAPVTNAHDREGAGGHNIVTGEEARTDAGKTGLGTGAVVGGLIGTAVGGPVGAVVGGAIGSLAGGVAGDATEAADDPAYASTSTTHETTYAANDPAYTTPRASAGAGYADEPYGTYQGRHITRADYEALPETDRNRVQLLGEELHVDKTTRESGQVEISKRIVEEQVDVPVTLEREEVVIHRRDVSGDARDARGGRVGEDDTIVVPVSEEVAQVSKSTHVTGEVEIEKRRVAEQRTVSDTVRREEIDVAGDQNVRHENR